MDKGRGGTHLGQTKIDFSKLEPVDTDPTKMIPDFDLLNTYTAKLETQVTETQDKFIFQTIGPFCNDIAGFEISKEELVEAIQLLRTMRQCKAIYGVDLYTTNIDNATYISTQCANAYQRGYEAGKEEMKEKMKDYIFSF